MYPLACQCYSMVINLVLATDIMDKPLGALRKKRWGKAFDLDVSISSMEGADEDPHDVVNRKATIVLEHLIQASDGMHSFGNTVCPASIPVWMQLTILPFCPLDID